MTTQVVGSGVVFPPNESVIAKQSTLAVAPAIAATLPVFTGALLATVRTSVPNEPVHVTFNADRDNAAAGGSGSYQGTVAGVAQGPIRTGTADLQNSVTLIADLIIAVAGTHTIGINVTSNVGIETVLAGATMQVQAATIVS